MCGIAGIFHFDKKPIRCEDLVSMGESLKHRGPDDAGIALLAENPALCSFYPGEKSCTTAQGYHSGFAHRRLSIIDTSSRGVQPMPDKTGELWIIYNGEIFNYLELKQDLELRGRQFRTGTDTEVLLEAYDEWDIGCLDKFNGMWAFAIWDTRRRRLFLARDRFGIKPLYYVFRDGCFVFASEPKALLGLSWISRDPDERAVADYLVHSREDCFEWTFFKDIKRLEPGCYFDIRFDADTLPEPRRWWNLAESLYSTPLSDSDCEDTFLDLLRSSVKLRLRSDVPVGTCLSGGLDSASVVCIARPWLEKGNQKTYSAVYGPSFNEDETKYVEEITRFIDVENYRVFPSAVTLLDDIQELVYYQDEPFGSTSQYAQFKVFELAHRNGTTVTLDGQGADEELAGYHYLYPVQVAGLVKKGKHLKALREFSSYCANTGASFTPAFLSTLAGFLSHRSMIRWANRFEPGRDISWVNRDIIKLGAAIRVPRIPELHDWLTMRLYELFTVSSLPALLRYEDRNSMAFSVEARLPFMDHRLVSFIFSLPAHQKIRDGWTKYIMRRALRGIIPETIRTRTDKIGFATPEAEWYRNEMLPYIRDVLNSPVTKKRGLYNHSELIGLIDANASGKINAGRAVWRALNLELWFRCFID